MLLFVVLLFVVSRSKSVAASTDPMHYGSAEMDEAKRDARRKLLAEIESSWDSPRPGAVAVKPELPAPEMQAALDAAADRLVESLNPPPVSAPALDDLDSGWAEDEDTDDDEDDEPEAELPDERLDPVAYAAAKKALEERVDARRERRRLKAEAKKGRRKARADAAKGKQKIKSRKARPSVAMAEKTAKASARGDAAARRLRTERTDGTDLNDDEGQTDQGEGARVPSHSRAKAPPSRPMATKAMLSGTNIWMLAIALLVFIAAAIFAAVVAR